LRQERGRWVENIWSGRITERNWEEERCKGYKSREEKVFTSKHTHQFVFGARNPGKGSCFACYYSYSSYYVLRNPKCMNSLPGVY